MSRVTFTRVMATATAGRATIRSHPNSAPIVILASMVGPNGAWTSDYRSLVIVTLKTRYHEITIPSSSTDDTSRGKLCYMRLWAS